MHETQSKPKNNRKQQVKLQTQADRPDRIALAVSDVLGSLWFLATFLSFITGYILWNSGVFPGTRRFDHAPFDVLDTILSIFAIVLSISVLISQKRQRHIEKIREEVEFEINVRAENEITKILEMLHEIQQKMGIDKSDSDLEEMKKVLDIDQLHQDIKRKAE